ncbi:hypothetical protein ACVW0P_001436 [Mucilaginibacter sp. UYNi724]
MKTKTQKDTTSPRDGNKLSPWQTGIQQKPAATVLYGTDKFDVLIIGAGITGYRPGYFYKKPAKRYS